ncbi:protein phosphatase 2C, putative [Entamoeba invadens IP1]|uniref:Protein phosphatase 2C, putative n=1 Tax=Entamoeba invadens IP1 TaxID=370355 RepID=A0A0A1U1E3_ENTIV|nr:protein phosphatase 2C, putative [Entamoeba invadens IP1]ELP86418.1 protein phosphatase 2C, putative [Entamoeba invadens IP1]|eukprot:XP_004185764.1 protein phosphatase 2C, putative [Entamoeba invadens IP1]
MISDFLSTPLDSCAPRMAYSGSPRARKPAMYRGTPPTFTSTLRCVQSGSDIGLPGDSWEIQLTPDGNVQKDGPVDGIIDLFAPLPRFSVGVAQTRGLRQYMEDYVCSCHLERNKDVIGVFDGHNGDQAAKQAATLLGSSVRNYMLLDDVHFIDLFCHLHKKIATETDSGTTGTVLYLGQDTVKVGFVGDCSVFLLGKDGITRITNPHRCGMAMEEKRIVANGGRIEEASGVRRVNGVINVTRTLGDRNLHPPLTFEPEIVSINVKKGYSHIVITTDGVDTVDIEEMEKLIRRSPSMSIAASSIRNEAFKQKSKDNISVVVVDLKFSQYERRTTSPLVDDFCIPGTDEPNPFDF